MPIYQLSESFQLRGEFYGFIPIFPAKKQVKVKEPVRLRFNELKDGRKSIYLDIYYNPLIFA